MKSFLTSAVALSFSLTSFAADDVLQTLQAFTTRAVELKANEVSASNRKQNALSELLERSYLTRQRVFAYDDVASALENMKIVEGKLASFANNVAAVDANEVEVDAAVHKQALSLQKAVADTCNQLENIVYATGKSQSYVNRIRLEISSSVLYVTNEEIEMVDDLVATAQSAYDDCSFASDATEVFVKNSTR